MIEQRAQITICGLGPGAIGDLTDQTRSVLAADRRVFLRTSRHPRRHWRPAPRPSITSTTADRLDAVYAAIADALVEAAGRRRRGLRRSWLTARPRAFGTPPPQR
ncbi:MAG: hypothetical protein R2710_09160 [Acidimicrobiales bacterium]